MRMTENVAHKGGTIHFHRIWWLNLRSRDHFEHPVEDGRIILVLILKTLVEGYELVCLRISTSGGQL
jgi:hypothetical protein